MFKILKPVFFNFGFTTKKVAKLQENIKELSQFKQRPNLKNLSGGLNISRVSNTVDFT